MRHHRLVCLVLASAAACGGTVHAAEGDWVLRVGAHNVDPKSNNGRLAGGTLRAEVGSEIRPTFMLEYFLSRNLGFEILAALPFEHEVKLNGVKAADVKHLPPTLSLAWHFNPEGRVSPFLGVGINYTTFFDIHETGPLAGTQLGLKKSWGAAVHAGVDFAIDERWSLMLDARWMDIDTEARVNGVKVGTVNIDPIVYGFAFGYRF
ncbi:OmpW/AlkL family protein [Tahibacter soli]|jgi:outer membrane protein|uniref:Outer membrane beta-barrel protein n=1 Tax=Tahibacter soli TaxID=2983605 RepID=A0A9X4BJA8_9GAMM|nr:OmpW family outer membrane protein [Tahibacter soli]MDC8014891.1 outer membrane beta-barrel protein [Tahibacter soli]